MTPGERSRQSGRILKRLFEHPRFFEARSVLFYVAQGREVETRPILEEARKKGKRVYVPRIDPRDKRIQMIEIQDFKELQPGSYGILEPPYEAKRRGDPKAVDLLVVPGVAFDREGRRLGRGEGYFDRLLREAGQAYKIGFAFREQIVERVPSEIHDVQVDEVLIG